MIRKASLLVIGTLVLLGAGSARAQGTDPLVVGNRVRVTLGSDQHRVAGRVLAADEQTLTLLAGDQPVKLSRAEITAAELSIGRRSALLKGAVIGAVAGIAVGFAIPVDESCPSVFDTPTSSSSCSDGAVHSRGEALGIGGFGGAFWGALIGHFVKHDVWAPTHLDRVRVGLVPKRHGAAVQVSLVF